MKKAITAILVFWTLSIHGAFAATQEITVSVKGMVCGFCAQGIEKKFTAEPAVDKVKVSLADKKVRLSLKDGQDLRDEAIIKVLTDSGYNVDKVERR